MDRAAFYSEVRKKFGRLNQLGRLNQSQVEGFEILLNKMAELPRSHMAYLLATAWHETGKLMQPIKETVSAHHKNKNPSDATVVSRLDTAWRAGKLKWVKTPYWRFDMQGKAWFGRGYVQLTHRSNYEKAAAMVGVDLLGSPDLAMRPDVAAQILVDGSTVGLFTGHKLSDFLPGDYRRARQIINGMDAADLIVGYAEAFERALQKAGVSEVREPPAKTASPEPVETKPKTSTIRDKLSKLKGWWRKT